MTALYHLEQTELAQVWRGGTALRSSPVTLERSVSVFYGVKDTMSCWVAKRGHQEDIVSFAGAMGWVAKRGYRPIVPVMRRGSTWGRERSDQGTQVVTRRWCDGWCGKRSSGPTSFVTTMTNECTK